MSESPESENNGGSKDTLMRSLIIMLIFYNSSVILSSLIIVLDLYDHYAVMNVLFAILLVGVAFILIGFFLRILVFAVFGRLFVYLTVIFSLIYFSFSEPEDYWLLILSLPLTIVIMFYMEQAVEKWPLEFKVEEREKTSDEPSPPGILSGPSRVPSRLNIVSSPSSQRRKQKKIYDLLASMKPNKYSTTNVNERYRSICILAFIVYVITVLAGAAIFRINVWYVIYYLIIGFFITIGFLIVLGFLIMILTRTHYSGISNPDRYLMEKKTLFLRYDYLNIEIYRSPLFSQDIQSLIIPYDRIISICLTKGKGVYFRFKDIGGNIRINIDRADRERLFSIMRKYRIRRIDQPEKDFAEALESPLRGGGIP